MGLPEDRQEGAVLKFYLEDEARARGVVPLAAPRAGDAGYDLRSMEELDIAPGGQALVRTGLHLAIPGGWVGLLRERSLLATKRIYVHSGVIDSAYRGEVLLVLENAGQEPYHVSINDRVAQMLILPHYAAPPTQVDSVALLGETERGERGFGSTGE